VRNDPADALETEALLEEMGDEGGLVVVVDIELAVCGVGGDLLHLRGGEAPLDDADELAPEPRS
jgi:hypothetical protein